MIKMDFRSIYNQGFARVAACTTTCRLADPGANAEAILALLAEVDAKAAALAVFPELALSGYAIDDLASAGYIARGDRHARSNASSPRRPIFCR